MGNSDRVRAVKVSGQTEVDSEKKHVCNEYIVALVSTSCCLFTSEPQIEQQAQGLSFKSRLSPTSMDITQSHRALRLPEH